jgi:tryptophanyl-tRNA synthetase
MGQFVDHRVVDFHEANIGHSRYEVRGTRYKRKCGKQCECEGALRTLHSHFLLYLVPGMAYICRLIMTRKKEIVVSGIRPTGYLHLGSYFGAIRNYIRMQEEYECFFMVADLHSLTTHPDTKELKKNVQRVIAENIACGLDPFKAAFYCQSHIYETSELYLYLNMLAYKGELEKTTTFKDKVRLQPDNINVGLLTYPVLQAADILLHRGMLVPVGKDQEQHLEMARNFAKRFNHRYGEIFPEPVAFNYGSELVKVPSLDGKGKMSKSENQMATLYLADEDDTIRAKIRKAKSDAGPTEKNSPKPDYIENLFTLLKLVAEPDTIKKFEDDYNNCTIQYGKMKDQLATDMIRLISPIREKINTILNDEKYLKEIMERGAEKARESARNTITLVRQVMGLQYY